MLNLYLKRIQLLVMILRMVLVCLDAFLVKICSFKQCGGEMVTILGMT